MRLFIRASMLVVSLVCVLVVTACGGIAAPTQTPFIIVVTAPPNSGESGVGVGVKTPTVAVIASPTVVVSPSREPTPTLAAVASPTISIQRQSTPPLILGATSTPTVPRPTSTATSVPPTDTPVPPTDTPQPPPPPTNTPRPAPPAALFRLDLHVHEGYEKWGTPKNGCQDFDNTRPVKKLTIDVTVLNDSTRPITPNDINVGFYDGGRELVWCVYTSENQPLPTAPPKGRATYVLTAFVDQSGYVSEMRIQIFGSTVRSCFARNNRADVVGCG